MHLLSLSAPVDLGKTIGTLGAGDWLMHDLNAFEIAQMAPRGAAKVRNWNPSEQSRTRVADRGRLIMRSGAIGDLLLLSPVLSAIKKWPINNRLSLCCFRHHFPLFMGNTDIEECVPYPLPLEEAGRYVSITSLENTMESDHSQHATDVFAKELQAYTSMEDYRPIYHVTDEEKQATKKHLFENRPNIAIQCRASVRNRDYPMQQWLEVITSLEKRGWGVLLLGHRGQIPPLPPKLQSPFIRNLAEEGLTFRESAAVLSQCQAFCGIDSAFLHLCHALDIPAVGLFAAFDYTTRIKSPKTFAITAPAECAPCSWHMHAGRHFPPNKPCSAVQQCVVLASIQPSRIVAKVEMLKP
jgi:ADP-heptose:LPS heptosyltransferase